MRQFRHWAACALLVTLPLSPLKGQEVCYQNDESYSSAYAQSSHTAHWSAYVPIGIMVAAAIWFGVADQKHERRNCSNTHHHKRHRSTTYTTTSGHY